MRRNYRIKLQQVALSPVIRSGLQLGRWQQTETQINGAFSEGNDLVKGAWNLWRVYLHMFSLGTHRSQHLTTTQSVHKVDSLATNSEDPPHRSR